MAPTTTALPVPSGTRLTPPSLRSITPSSAPESLRSGRWPVPKLHPIPVWAQRVRSRSEELRARTEVLVRAGHLTDPAVVARVDELLDSATERAEHDWGLRAWTGFKDWWLGSSAETAWYQLHLAERLMLAGVEDETQLVALVAPRTEQLPREDPEVVAYRRLCERLRRDARRGGPAHKAGHHPISGADRAVVDELVDHSMIEACRFNQRARAFRNRLFLLSTFALIATALVILVQCWVPEATIMRRPAEAGVNDNAQLLSIVAVFGMLGGLVSAIPSLGRASRELNAFNVGMQRALQKVATGGLTAIIGVIALSNANLTAGYSSLQSLLAVAIAFGAAQQVVTRGLDDHAVEIVRSAPERDGSAAVKS